MEKLNLFTKHFLQTVIINVVLMRLTAPGLFKGFCCQKCKLFGIPMGLETFLNSLKKLNNHLVLVSELGLALQLSEHRFYDFRFEPLIFAVH